ncbi:MAG: ABC transporter ATP-binding protein [Rhodospirillales bacterium]|nr:ABC transporter ATP-binding protein [Rhodospirillales bacterium]
MTVGMCASGLGAGYGGFQVIADLELAVDPGSITAIIGANGAGKTTLLNGLAGLLPRTGTVSIGERMLKPSDALAAVRAGLALVPEGRRLFPKMTVIENLELGGWLLPRHERARRVDWVLEMFPRLSERRDQLAGTMSGGEQQMLAIGRALAGRPRVLMLDEPSLGLAPRMVDELLSLVARIRDEGITILLVEQNVAKALAIADHAYVIERGRMVAAGPAATVLTSDLVQAAYLGVA